MSHTTYEVTLERVQGLLNEEGLPWRNAGNSGMYFSFLNMTVVLRLSERIFTISAHWRGTSTDPADVMRMIEFATDFNYQRSLPKVYVHGDGSSDAPLNLVMEYGFPTKHGLSDAQLSETFGAVMGAVMSGMSEVETTFPELVIWNEEK